ncbi:hypothetical protein DM02DRAFT_82576 [Periconia macrospinosa]|uniref:Uncharacterized protein n=1 Tax=Periconia macrospinosa TaxID=97972 RepID=A0A2V1DI98_9PLEO|nr:hypothetical protein DM02DRAFT_82576 [Periconia macrospinosa]
MNKCTCIFFSVTQVYDYESFFPGVLFIYVDTAAALFKCSDESTMHQILYRLRWLGNRRRRQKEAGNSMIHVVEFKLDGHGPAAMKGSCNVFITADMSFMMVLLVFVYGREGVEGRFAEGIHDEKAGGIKWDLRFGG